MTSYSKKISDLKIVTNNSILTHDFYSQAGQDIFVALLTKGKTGGKFIDIGAAHPIKINNTFLLESKYGWSGHLIEIDNELCELLRSERTSRVVQCDATIVNYHEIFEKEGFIDYVSCDIDGENTITVLKMMPISLENVGIVTFEHESYRLGDSIKERSRKIMLDLGFYLLCADVKNQGNSFEDWYVNPNVYDVKEFSILSSNDNEWTDIIFK